MLLFWFLVRQSLLFSRDFRIYALVELQVLEALPVSVKLQDATLMVTTLACSWQVLPADRVGAAAWHVVITQSVEQHCIALVDGVAVT